MDFSFTEDQHAIAALASQILSDRCTLQRLKEIEASEDRYDRDLWAELAKAGLLGAALPESAGGSGGGFVEACLFLEAQGKAVALIPFLSTVVSAAMPIARFGTAEQQQHWLPGVASGETILSAALTELRGEARSPVTTAARDGSGWRLAGVKSNVPMAHRAAAVLVPARTPDGAVAVLLVDPRARGVTLDRQEATNWEAQFRMQLADVAVGAAGLLGSTAKGAEILDWIVDRTTVGLCAIASGTCQAALKLTAEYASNRKQFDKPIAMFQAVGQRMADSFIDNEAVSVTMLQAVSRLADEMPSAREIATAKYWAAEGGSRIAHAGLHIHGGISIDVDYPIHRHFLWIKEIENTLGAATPQLERLGSILAGDPA